MRTQNKPETASAPETRTSQQLANARKHLPDIDATLEAMRTIPAEKPTDMTAQEIARMENAWALDEWNMARESAKYKAHAEKLAEALREIASGNHWIGKQQSIAKQALAAYESEVRS